MILKLTELLQSWQYFTNDFHVLMGQCFLSALVNHVASDGHQTVCYVVGDVSGRQY